MKLKRIKNFFRKNKRERLKRELEEFIKAKNKTLLNPLRLSHIYKYHKHQNLMTTYPKVCRNHDIFDRTGCLLCPEQCSESGIDKALQKTPLSPAEFATVRAQNPALDASATLIKELRKIK